MFYFFSYERMFLHTLSLILTPYQGKFNKMAVKRNGRTKNFVLPYSFRPSSENNSVFTAFL